MYSESWPLRPWSSLHISVLHEIILALQIFRPNKIDLAASFVENGGDSISSFDLQAGLRAIGITVSFETILTTHSISQLIQHAVSKYCAASAQGSLKRQLPDTPQLSDEGPPKRPRKGSMQNYSNSEQKDLSISGPLKRQYPMTELQLALIHSSLSYSDRNVIHYHETHRSKDLPLLRRAWNAVLEIEPIFRMKFEVNETGGHMVEQERIRFMWDEIAVHDEDGFLEEVERQDLDYSIKNGHPVCCFKVVTLGAKSIIVWRVHHVLIDERSRNLILGKRQQYLMGETIVAGPSFGEFSHQLQLLQTQFQDVGKAFWAQQQKPIATAAAALLLPPPHRIPKKQMHHVDINVHVSELSSTCKRAAITLPTLYYAAWALTLARYADADDVCFGAVFCGQALSMHGFDAVVGPTINSLPLHVDIDRTATVEDWLRRIFERLVQLFSFQWTSADHGFSRSFPSAMNVQISPEEPGILAFGPTEPPSSTVLSDIPLQIDVSRSGKTRFSYHTSTYSVAQIETVADAFCRALKLLQHPKSTMGQCLDWLVLDAHRVQVSRFGNWNSPTTRKDSVKNDLVSLFEDTAERYPNIAAVSQGSKTLTYAQLQRRSSVVARKLACIVSPDDVVCVYADRSIEWIIAIYGVLKANAVYCPFTEDMPSAVKDVNFQTSNAKVFLTGTNIAKASKPASCQLCFSVEEILSDLIDLTSSASAGLSRRDAEYRPNAPAYLCFTSGSTGKPKGVLCRHKGLVAFQSDFEVRLHARPNWRIAQFMSPAFDGSIHEIFSALSYGAQLILKDHADPLGHLRTADAAILTPSVAMSLDPDSFPCLSTVYLVGESVPQSVCDTWATKKTLYNMYGPTEATCGASIKRLNAGQSVTLGTPNPSTRIYILDSKRSPTPPGVIGEIYLAGVQVAAGYVGRPEETAERFLPDSVQAHLNEDMYKTGDRGYWSDGGELMFLGRGDRQIKLRGFRIDMDDLEIRLLQSCTQVTGAAITLKDDYLVAQIQPAGIDVHGINDQIRNHIPNYAMPRFIVAVASFPLTSTGKVDYKNMAKQNYAADPNTTKNMRQSPSQDIISIAVHNILGIPETTTIDLDSSFVDLGGNSLLYLQLSNRLSQCFGRRVPLHVVLGASSLRDLDALLSASNTDQMVTDLDCIADSDELQLSPIEMDWWVKHQRGGSSSFNVTFACDIGPLVDAAKLEAAWNLVLDRHRILRSTYQPCSVHGARREYHQQSPSVTRVNEMDIRREIQIPFDLQSGHLVRVLVSPIQMLVLIHHILCDLTTLRILLGEVATAYLGTCLPQIRKSYCQVQWSLPNSSNHFRFWSDYLSELPSSPYLIGNNSERTTWAGTSHTCLLPNQVHSQMRKLAVSQKVTMHQIALAAVALALQHRNETCDITLGAPYLNRNSEEDQSVVGLFIEPLPIRIRYDTARSESFVQAVHRSSRAALSHAVPWHQLLSHLNITPRFPNNPIFDVMVTLHDKKESIEFSILDTEPLNIWADGAKFKIMAEFTACKDESLSLRLEYSTDCFGEDDILQLERWIVLALDSLSQEEDYLDIRRKLRVMSG
jgi:amino acid adenylation domain-containing protein